MGKSVTVLLPGGLAKTAAINAGLPPTTGLGALIRAAAVMFNTGDIDKALSSMERRSNARTVGGLSRDGNHKVGAYIGDAYDELATVPNKSQAIRTGLALLIGWERVDAEAEQFVRRQGRPEKVSADA